MAERTTSAGALITLEGIDGAGKSTHVALLADHLGQRGRRVVVTREPGATPLGRELRRLLLESDLALGPESELLLFLADRVEHVRSVIRPALAVGAVVLCDRFSDSTMAYQGYGRRADLARVARWDAESRDGVHADLTLLLDCPIPVAAERRRSARDRYQVLDTAFHTRVRDGFLALAAAEPDRIRRVDASRPIAAVQADVAAAVDAWLDARGDERAPGGTPREVVPPPVAATPRGRRTVGRS
jgi:dTMP kinase